MRKKKIFPFELIGEDVAVVKAANKSLVGIEGRVVDETRCTLKILHLGKVKILLKRAVNLRLQKNGFLIKGETIVGRSEDRLRGK